MRWNLLPFALIAAIVSLSVGISGAEADQDSPVLAFFYPWYNKAQFDRSQMWDVPVAAYDSDARGTMERQVREARGAGITGFISSWDGRGTRRDRNFTTLLDVSRGTDFASTIYFETGDNGLTSQQAIVDALRYLMSTYGSHPNFARIGGKPAVFFWNPSAAGPADSWRRIRSQVDPDGQWHWNVETDRPENWLEVFDGIHLFSAASWTADATGTYKNLKAKVEAVATRTGKPKLFAAGVAPGWDNTRQSNPVQVQVGRDSGSYYSRRWDSAVASSPGAITITSWNEWGEGTAIEPGSSYGTLYLDITKRYSGVFRQGAVGANVALSAYRFKLGFAALAAQIPSVVGLPLEDEHSSTNGDSLQMTSNGLLVWRKADNWTAFTDGSRTWVNGPYGIRQRANEERFPWEGTP